MEATLKQVLRRTPVPLRPAVELIVRTVVDAFRDRVPGLAAEMAFYLILSLPPLLITVFAGVALAGTIVDANILDNAQGQVLTVTSQFLTPDAAEDVNTILGNVRREAQAGIGVLLSFGFLLTVFSASRALRVTSIAITIAYDLEETRPGWQQFLYGIGLTLGAVVAGIVVVPFFVGGPGLGQALVNRFGAPQQLADAWRLAYWPGATLTLTLLLAALYHVAAPWYTPWRRDLPGAVVAMVIGLLGSYGLRLYTSRAIGGGLFGPLAAPLVLLLWLYVMSFAVLLGAEFNAEIERMWPTKRPDQPEDQEHERVEHPARVSDPPASPS